MSTKEDGGKKVSRKGAKGWKFKLLLCVLILLLAGAATVVIFMTEPKAVRGGATKETAMLVDTITVEKGHYTPRIVAMGTVRPEKEIVLSSRVAGEVVEWDARFVPGGNVKKGDVLLKIDPADYENILRQRESELRRAEADLEIEKGRQNVARKEYRYLDKEIGEEQRALVLREPQLMAAEAAVTNARTAVDQAGLDLERTAVRAPFDAHVLERNANIGTQVAVGDQMGRLVGTSSYTQSHGLEERRIPDWQYFSACRFSGGKEPHGPVAGGG